MNKGNKEEFKNEQQNNSNKKRKLFDKISQAQPARNLFSDPNYSRGKYEEKKNKIRSF